MENFKIIEMRIKGADVKNRFLVYQLCYVNRDNKPKYRLVKQCYSAELAQKYVADKMN